MPLLTSLLALLLTTPSLATPTTLTHQGRLLDTDGRPVDGVHTLAFGLYDAADGGAEVWSEVHAVPFSAGLYTVELGTRDALDEGLFDGRTL